MNDFIPTIGLEIHINLKSQTKMFCRCTNDFFDTVPNSNVCPVCMGLPGTLPRLSEECLILGIKLARALNLNVNKKCNFDRKNYFYPDLPLGYQITQQNNPLANEGFIEILSYDGKVKKYDIEKLHIENDAGKLIHSGVNSYVDYNRAGQPLAELVSKPTFHNEKEVIEFLKEIQLLCRYNNISQCDMEKGELRCDVNISIAKKGSKKLGTKVEVKNLNSFVAISSAILYEINRQIEMHKNNEKIIQETRGWNDIKKMTISQRQKEEANDYRYFTEPDLYPIEIDDDYIKNIESQLVEGPSAKILRFMKDYNMNIDDAKTFAMNIKLAVFFEKLTKTIKDYKLVSNILLSHLLFLQKENDTDEIIISEKDFIFIFNLIQENKLSKTNAKILITRLFYKEGDINKLIEKHNLLQVSDDDYIKKVVIKILDQNKAIVEKYKNGHTNVFGFFVGQVMKETQGKANPKLVNEILQSLLK